MGHVADVSTYRTENRGDRSDPWPILRIMKFLFDSSGRHIANLVNGQLHAPRGENVGHWMEREQIFIDMRGRYLGQLLGGDRLVRQRNSPYRSVNFGVYGNHGNVGNYGNPGRYGRIALPGGYEDVEATWL